MDKLKKSDIDKAIAHVLGQDVFGTLVAENVPLPTLLEMAGLKAFQEDWHNDSHIYILKKALRELQSPGYITFEREKQPEN